MLRRVKKLRPFFSVIRELHKVSQRSQLQNLAASMAYSTVLSIAPLIAVVLGVAQVMGYLLPAIDRLQPTLLEYFAAGTGRNLVLELEESVGRLREGAIGSLGFLSLVFVSIKLLNDVDLAFHSIWEVAPHRGWLRRLVLFSTFLVAGPVLLTLLLGLSSASYLMIFPAWMSYFVGAAALTVLFYFLFRYVPCCEMNWRSALGGAFLTAVSLILLQSMYGWITKNLMNYDKIYGSLSSIFLFLVWLLIVWNFILLGVALSATLQRHSSKLKETPR